MKNMKEFIAIIDFGSQYSQLIARRIRECNVYCEIYPPQINADRLRALSPSGIIFSGGPSSLTQKNAPRCDKNIFKLRIPILGICYGMQLTAQYFGGCVGKATAREYGKTELYIQDKKDLFAKLDTKIITWMSHGDKVIKLPKDFKVLAYSRNCRIACFANRKLKIYGVQFHPEVVHTPEGKNIIKNFLYNICGCHGLWTMKSFIKDAVKQLHYNVGKSSLVLGLSGGVDSSVCAVLLHKALKKKLHCIFVDNGLLRIKESQHVRDTFQKHYHMNFHYINAQNLFLKQLKGVIDPEKKRKIIGRLFIRVFEQEAKRIRNIKFLAQGTLYPDVIESRSVFGGPSAKIKSHHNVGGLPKKMHLKLIEPLKYLFKDEVRILGRELKLPNEFIQRHPFPGPGLAVRIVGAVTKKRLEILRRADVLFIEEIRNQGLYNKIWQAFTVLLPVKSVGVMGDERTYENTVALRAVTSVDGMTADWAKLPPDLLGKVSNRIINEVKGVNRVVYDISSKPPATIEWE
ncbi:MAG: glutamine-hydrolyzing GMP synthase [Candidatus Omnitrophica bacterium]|nr:glutamine-hydrolyzing GMP synthase [Candidatus Omnitrophota bacterium]